VYNTKALGRVFVTKIHVTGDWRKPVQATNAYKVFAKRYHTVVVVQSGTWLPTILRDMLLPCSRYFCPQYGYSMLFRNKCCACPCHEGILGKQRYSSTHPYPRRYMEVSGQHHAPAALTPGNYPGTHSIGGRVGPKAGLDVLKKNLFPLLGFKPRTVQPADKTRGSDYEIPHCSDRTIW
jgi:hypothetical protein